jgi:hypothetical protein
MGSSKIARLELKTLQLNTRNGVTVGQQKHRGNGGIQCTFNVAQGGDIADTLMMVEQLKERLLFI